MNHILYSPFTLIRLCVVLFLVLIANVVFAQSTAIRAGHVISPHTREVLENQTIVISDGKIAKMPEIGGVVYDQVPAGLREVA